MTQVYSLPITALPIVMIPIFVLLLSIIVLHLYFKLNKRIYLYMSISLIILTSLSFITFKTANQADLQFWSVSYHISSITVLGVIMTISGWHLIVNRNVRIGLISLFFLSILTLPLPYMISSTLLFISFVVYSIFVFRLLNKINEPGLFLVQSSLMLGLGLFGLIGQWLPFTGGILLYGIVLLSILITETFRIFDFIVRMIKVAGIKSITDPLTGLYNRGFMIKKVEQLAEKGNISIIFSDIDDFKKLNDTLGHAAGDQALKKVAQCLRDVLGPKDYACRFGGEEIVGIVSNNEEPQKIAEKYRIKVEKETGVTVSVGVASGKGNGNDIIKEADKRVYKAKSSGKNQVIYID